MLTTRSAIWGRLGTFRGFVLSAAILALLLLPAFVNAAGAQGLQGSSVLALDGANDYATAPDGPKYDVGNGATDDFTLETMFHVSGVTSVQTGNLFYKNSSYMVYVLFNVSGDVDRIIYRLYVPGDYVYLWYDVTLSDGWHHIAAVFDNEYTGSSDLFAIYLDGNLVKSGTAVDWSPGLPNSASAFCVGGAFGINSFPGWLEETRISNSVRYSGSTYTVPSAPFGSDANCLALWHFDGASGSTSFLDTVGGGYDLTGVNGAATHNDDSVAPSAPTLDQPVTPTNQTAVTLSGNAEGNSTVLLYDGDVLLGTTTAASGGAYSLGATLLHGSHTLTAKARDGAGNTSVASSSRSVIVDTLAPAMASLISPTHPDENLWYPNDSPSFNWSANDGLSGVSGYSYLFDQSPSSLPDGVSEGATTSASYTDRADGEWYFHVRARDAAGNWGVSAHRRVRIQTTVPLTTIRLVAPTKVFSYNTTASFSATMAAGMIPVEGHTDVALWRLRAGSVSWSRVATMTWDAVDHRYEGACKVTYIADYQVRHEGVLSSSVKVNAKPYLSNPIAPSHAHRNRSFVVKGYLKPRHTPGSYPVRIYKYRYVSGRWKSYGYTKAKAYNYSTYTKYSRSISLPYRGRWRLRAVAPADRDHVSTKSKGYEYIPVR